MNHLMNSLLYLIGLLIVVFAWNTSDLRISFSILWAAYMICDTIYRVTYKKIIINDKRTISKEEQ